MPWLFRVHGGMGFGVLILGTTTLLFGQNAHPQETSGDHTVQVQCAACFPDSGADSAQPSRSKAGSHLDHSAVNVAGSQNAPQSAGEQPIRPSWAPIASDTEGAEAQRLPRALGTAAAPAPALLPIAAAEPTGIAIAPAKQRRVRKIVLKVGALLGASAALTSVLILTETTASKPAVAH